MEMTSKMRGIYSDDGILSPLRCSADVHDDDVAAAAAERPMSVEKSHCMTHCAGPSRAGIGHQCDRRPQRNSFDVLHRTVVRYVTPSYWSHLPRHLPTERMLRSRSSIIAEATSRFRTSDKSNDIGRRWRRSRAHLNGVGDSAHDVVD